MTDLTRDVAEGINLPPMSKHERQVLAGQDSPEADAMFERPASRVREDDEDGPCPSCEDGCERCDPRYLRDKERHLENKK